MVVIYFLNFHSYLDIFEISVEHLLNLLLLLNFLPSLIKQL